MTFDIKFNCGISVAMRIRKRFKEKCVPLQTVCAGQLLTFSVEHHRSKFYRTFNCIYSRSKASNSEMISVELLKSYCFPFLFFVVDAMSLSSTNIRILENCINRALLRVFGSCDKSSLEYIKICTGLHNIKDLVRKSHCSFIDKLISDVRFSNLLLNGSNALYRF